MYVGFISIVLRGETAEFTEMSPMQIITA